MVNLGLLLQERGGRKNLAEAQQWFDRAHQHGFEPPQ
jgi:hypothetical protein